MDERVKELEKALRRFGRHKDQCAAFPATSEEQLARDCNCGLTAALSGAPLREREQEVSPLKGVRCANCRCLFEGHHPNGCEGAGGNCGCMQFVAPEPTDQGAAQQGRAPQAPPAATITHSYPCCYAPLRVEDGGGALPCPRHGKEAIATLTRESLPQEEE